LITNNDINWILFYLIANNGNNGWLLCLIANNSDWFFSIKLKLVDRFIELIDLAEQLRGLRKFYKRKRPK